MPTEQPQDMVLAEARDGASKIPRLSLASSRASSRVGTSRITASFASSKTAVFTSKRRMRVLLFLDFARHLQRGRLAAHADAHSTMLAARPRKEAAGAT